METLYVNSQAYVGTKMKPPLLNEMLLDKAFLTVNTLPWIVIISFIFKAFAMALRGDSGKNLIALNEMLLNSRCRTQAPHVAVSG